MPMTSIYYSTKRDDPLEGRKMMGMAIEYARQKNISFSTLAAFALRAYLGMPPISIADLAEAKHRLRSIATSQRIERLRDERVKMRKPPRMTSEAPEEAEQEPEQEPTKGGVHRKERHSPRSHGGGRIAPPGVERPSEAELESEHLRNKRRLEEELPLDGF